MHNLCNYLLTLLWIFKKYWIIRVKYILLIPLCSSDMDGRTFLRNGMACSAELVESKNWNEYSETFFCKSTTMDEVVLLLMLKLLRKARNVGVLFQHLKVCRNFILLITFYCNSRNKQENENSEYSQYLQKEWGGTPQGANDNLYPYS